MKTRTLRRTLYRLIPQRAVLAAAAVLISATAPAIADDTGTCPGVDLVETSLENGKSSGYYIPGLKLIILNRTILQNDAPEIFRDFFTETLTDGSPIVRRLAPSISTPTNSITIP